MMVLVAKSPTTIHRDYMHPNVGILIGPRKVDSCNAASFGLKWAADNDCFNGGFNEDAYTTMLEKSREASGCLFVAVPDVVGDADATLAMFDEWVGTVAGYGFPPALVLQDGMTPADIRWLEVDAVFIGGTTEWKLSDDAYRIVSEAKAQGKWVHMGRVNTRRRIKVAKAWECNSIDGTSTVMYTDTHLPWQLDQASAPTQLHILNPPQPVTQMTRPDQKPETNRRTP